MPAAKHPVHTRWWKQEGAGLATEVVSICDALESDYGGRRQRALQSLRLYENRVLKGLYAGAYSQANVASDTAKEVDDLVFPLYKSLVHTAQAKIAGKQKPRPMFLTNGGDWKAQRRAKKLDKFVEAVLHQPQGRYLNGWQLALDVYIDCLVWGVGVIKVFPDIEEERICLERKFPFELYCDVQEARSGSPLNLFDVYPCDRDIALATFAPGYDPEDQNPDDEEYVKGAAIENAEAIDDEDETYGGTRRVAQQIRLREAFRLPLSSKLPGKHAVVTNGVALVEEDWTRPDFPYVILRWTGDRIGFFGAGLVEESESQIEEINRAAQRIQERMIIAASKRVYYEENSIDTEALESNEAETLVAVKPGSQIPVETVPTPFNQMELEYLGFHFLKLYDTSGISHATATAKNEPGVTSGVAIQNLNDMQSELFAPKSRAYEDAFVGLGRQIVWCADELGGKLEVKLPALTALKSLKFSDAKMKDHEFHVVVAPVSSMPNDPAGRIDLAEKMFNTGLIGPETQKRMASMPDVEYELQRENAEYNYLEDVIDRFSDADEGERVYESPEGFLSNKVGAIQQFGQAYFDAKLKKAPEHVLELFRRYIKELDKMITRAAEAAAQQAAAAAMPPAGAPSPPGAAIPSMGAGAPPLPPGAPPGAVVN